MSPHSGLVRCVESIPRHTLVEGRSWEKCVIIPLWGTLGVYSLSSKLCLWCALLHWQKMSPSPWATALVLTLLWVLVNWGPVGGAALVFALVSD